MMKTEIYNLIKQLGLPSHYHSVVDEFYLLLSSKIINKLPDHAPMVLGLQGTQGSGKSTCAEFLKLIFEHEHKLKCLVISIDDFYLTREERMQLATDVHPLLSTRGVPGTHDVDLGIRTFDKLKTLIGKQTISIPRFDKSIDDRAAPSEWTSINEPVDIIIFEGWCVGLESQDPKQLIHPINDLERDEDAGCIWRTYVNQHLAVYQSWYDSIDELIVLQAPSFECVYDWRLLQEQKLIARNNEMSSAISTKTKTMSPVEIERFISHYERLTRHALSTVYKKASWVLYLDSKQQAFQLRET